MGPHADRGGRGGRELGSGGSRCTTFANSVPCWRAKRRLSRRGARGRCSFRRYLRTRAGAYWGECAAGSKAGGKYTAAGPPALQPHAPSIHGRSLTADAADAFVAVVTNGKVKGDKVGPHGDLLPEFPYLGPPHNWRYPTTPCGED